MSSGLMSCVRKNSPPLQMVVNESGPLSLPDTSVTAPTASSSSLIAISPGAMSVTCELVPSTTEQQKRRRFHPLRNLRRIFRRRTITSVNDSPLEVVRATSGDKPSPGSSGTASEKDLRSTTIFSTSPHGAASISFPSSPHSPQVLHANSYLGSKSLPKTKVTGAAHRNVLLDAADPYQQHQHQIYRDADVMYSTGQEEAASYNQRHVYRRSSELSSSVMIANSELHPVSSVSGNRSSPMGGVAVLPAAFNVASLSRSFFGEREELKSLCDTLKQLGSTVNSSLASESRHVIVRNKRSPSHNNTISSGEITDNQRSFSEGLLMESNYLREGLSQSHDGVFSESANASSLSIVLKAGLADALRKRRNRPVASHEDLDLPHSPASPQRRSDAMPNTSTPNTAGNQSKVSSLSTISMNSNDDDLLSAEVASSAITLERDFANSALSRHSRISAVSSLSLSSSDIPRQSSSVKADTFGGIDYLCISNWQRLSHSAAKHKMGVRPTKKRGPSRQHWKSVETSIPETNEELFKVGGNHLLDLTDQEAKTKAHSLPPDVGTITLEQHGDEEMPSTGTVSITTVDVGTITLEQHVDEEMPSTGTVSNTPVTVTATAVNTTREDGSTKSFDAKYQAAVRMTTKNSFSQPATTSFVDSLFDSNNEDPTNMSSVTAEMQKQETNKSGFLRRIIQRSSKRSISKAAGDDVVESQSGPKMLQISISAFDTREFIKSPSLDKSQSAIEYDQKVENTRKEIKRDILSEGNAGLSAMLNTYPMAPSLGNERLKPGPSVRDTAVSPIKPKSGPAARQRFLPQEIPTANTLERSTHSEISKYVPSASPTKSLNEESFQSTSIIRQITTCQGVLAASESEHHFEKNPKLNGISSLQQKLSRSSDSCSHFRGNNTSNASADKSGKVVCLNYDGKERKSEEKSRSFRGHNEDKECSFAHHIPSLPDLSLQLPRFDEFILNEEYSSPSPPGSNDKSMSLGFQINDNNLIRPAPRAESTHSLSSFDQSGDSCKMSNKRSTSPKFLPPPSMVLPNLSPTNSIAEIEQTIDMIVKSPFVNVVHKPENVNGEPADKSLVRKSLEVAVPKSRSGDDSQELYSNEMLKEEQYRPELLSPTIVAVSSIASGRGKELVSKLAGTVMEPPTKESEKKFVTLSSPVLVSNTTSNTNSFSRARRSCSITESSSCESSSSVVPEFLKIQLNRVDPCARSPKSTVVLAKNVREPPAEKETSERSASNDNLSLRRCTNGNLEICKDGPLEIEKQLFGTINRQTKPLNTSTVRCKANELPLKSPVKIQKTPPTSATQIETIVKQSSAPSSTNPTTPLDMSTEETVVLRRKPAEIDASVTTHKLSLQERKRFFMNEEKLKVDKEVEELRSKGKKSFDEELQRSNSNGKNDPKGSLETTKRELVTLRKKSFGVNSLNKYTGSSSSSSNPTNSSGSTGKDDTTPELMKVFARRSLKIKDEDLASFTDNILPVHSAPLKKTHVGHSNVDSDKENQSTSEEKLDWISKKVGVAATEQTNGKVIIINTPSCSSATSAVKTNRNSLADFRCGIATHKNGTSLTRSISIQNNNDNTNGSLQTNNFNNNNNNVATANTMLLSKSYSSSHGRLTAGFCTISVIEQRNGSDRNLHGALSSVSGRESIVNNDFKSSSCGGNQKTIVERQSRCARAEAAEPGKVSGNNKTIERSATLSEFKGIHQRRAEWEQRVKEALK